MKDRHSMVGYSVQSDDSSGSDNTNGNERYGAG